MPGSPSKTPKRIAYDSPSGLRLHMLDPHAEQKTFAKPSGGSHARRSSSPCEDPDRAGLGARLRRGRRAGAALAARAVAPAGRDERLGHLEPHAAAVAAAGERQVGHHWNLETTRRAGRRGSTRRAARPDARPARAPRTPQRRRHLEQAAGVRAHVEVRLGREHLRRLAVAERRAPPPAARGCRCPALPQQSSCSAGSTSSRPGIERSSARGSSRTRWAWPRWHDSWKATRSSSGCSSGALPAVERLGDVDHRQLELARPSGASRSRRRS